MQFQKTDQLPSDRLLVNGIYTFELNISGRNEMYKGALSPIYKVYENQHIIRLSIKMVVLEVDFGRIIRFYSIDFVILCIYLSEVIGTYLNRKQS